MAKVRFIYSFARFVPSLSSGEFVNIGAVAGSDVTGEWGCRFCSLDRMDALAKVYSVDPKIISIISISSIEALVEDYNRRKLLAPMEGVFKERIANSIHMLQFSSPGWVLADNPAEVLDFIFEDIFPKV